MAIIRANSFAFPRQWNPAQVPTCPVEVDQNNALFYSLQEWFVPGISYSGLVHAAPSSIYGTAYPAVTPAGQGLTCTAGSLLVGSAFGTNQPPFTISALIFPTSSSASGSIVGASSVDNSGRFSPLLEISGGELYLINQGNSVIGQCSGVPSGVSHVTASYDSSNNWVLYINGNSVASGNTSWNNGVAINPMSIGWDSSHPTGYFPGQILDVKWHNSILPASLVAMLAAEPFAMLRPIVRRQYYAVSGTATPVLPPIITGIG